MLPSYAVICVIKTKATDHERGSLSCTAVKTNTNTHTNTAAKTGLYLAMPCCDLSCSSIVPQVSSLYEMKTIGRNLKGPKTGPWGTPQVTMGKYLLKY